MICSSFLSDKLKCRSGNAPSTIILPNKPELINKFIHHLTHPGKRVSLGRRLFFSLRLMAIFSKTWSFECALVLASSQSSPTISITCQVQYSHQPHVIAVTCYTFPSYNHLNIAELQVKVIIECFRQLLNRSTLMIIIYPTITCDIRVTLHLTFYI